MKHFALVLAALITVTSCTSPKSSTATPTSTTAVTNDPTTPAPSTTTTTTVVSVDPSVPPPVVDLPYLTAVMAKLNLLDLQQLAVIERDKHVTPEAVTLLRAEFAEPALDDELTDVALSAAKPTRNVKPPALRGPIITTAIRLVTTTPRCVSFIATEDFSQLAASPVPVGMDLITLRSINRAKDPEHLNSTPWQISYAVIPKDPAHPTAKEDLCAS